MKKFILPFSLLLALALMLAAAPAAMADDDPYVGNWSGTWTCAGSGCEKTGGTMHGNITKNGSEYGGQFTMENTLAGTISGPLQAWDRGGLNGRIDTSAGSIGFLGKVNGNTFEGTFESQGMGNGSFRLNRQ
ncbi:MAG: hypothetical protein K9K66_10495 [Desulfarculaceae bacterium]|nr:hypothetical protein [Desulfarculaceae bacterium]MCF8074085.1 hypothetical protein [Desulfarculaceae bacterium]MCF8102077.1 hypothetical protein [Desulfarculaceae bacterium]MCF8118115.1 hypothetical protein [Desulfarculaceae bacterium]